MEFKHFELYNYGPNLNRKCGNFSYLQYLIVKSDIIGDYELIKSNIISNKYFKNYINHKNDKGYTALILSFIFLNSKYLYEIVELLIQNGADINIQSCNRDSALLLCNDIEIMKLLIQNGADVNIRGECGKTKLMRVIQENYNFEVTKSKMDLLLDNGAKIDLFDDFNNNIIGYIFRLNNDVILKFIEYFKKRNNINIKEYINNDCETLLHKACRYSNPNFIKILIDNGLDVNHKSKTGITPIMSACMNEKNDIEIIKLLFDNGANIKEEKYDKNHYLLILCEKSRSKNILDIMKLLIKNGSIHLDKAADIFAKRGHTRNIKIKNYSDVVKFFIENGYGKYFIRNISQFFYDDEDVIKIFLNNINYEDIENVKKLYNDVNKNSMYRVDYLSEKKLFLCMFNVAIMNYPSYTEFDKLYIMSNINKEYYDYTIELNNINLIKKVNK